MRLLIHFFMILIVVQLFSCNEKKLDVAMGTEASAEESPAPASLEQLVKDKGPGHVELGMTFDQIKNLVGKLELTFRRKNVFVDYWQDNVPFDVFGKRPACAGYSFSGNKLVMMIFAFKNKGIVDTLNDAAIERYGMPTMGIRYSSMWKVSNEVSMTISGTMWGCGQSWIGYEIPLALDRSPAYIHYNRSTRKSLGKLGEKSSSKDSLENLGLEKSPAPIKLDMTFEDVTKRVGKLKQMPKGESVFEEFRQDNVLFEVFDYRPSCAIYTFSKGKLVLMAFGFKNKELFTSVSKTAVKWYGMPTLSFSQNLLRWEDQQGISLMILPPPWPCGEFSVAYYKSSMFDGMRLKIRGE